MNLEESRAIVRRLRDQHPLASPEWVALNIILDAPSKKVVPAIVGPTNVYPLQRKLSNYDKGELAVAISVMGRDTLRVDFGVPVDWIALTGNQIDMFVALLLEKRKELSR